jgi:hypothetical protein
VIQDEREPQGAAECGKEYVSTLLVDAAVPSLQCRDSTKALEKIASRRLEIKVE